MSYSRELVNEEKINPPMMGFCATCDIYYNKREGFVNKFGMVCCACYEKTKLILGCPKCGENYKI